jgi:hypothetical protein
LKDSGGFVDRGDVVDPITMKIETDRALRIDTYDFKDWLSISRLGFYYTVSRVVREQLSQKLNEACKLK